MDRPEGGGPGAPAPGRGRAGMLRRGLAAVALAGLGLAARQALTASFAFEATDPVPPRRASLPTSPLRDDPAGGCPLCREDLDVPVVPLSAADADSFGRVYAAFNAAWLGRADSLLAAGAFGSPASREARDKAHLMARLLVVNSLHYMVGFATDPERVYEASEATLRRAFQRYSDPGVYPIARMRRGRMGMGRICVRYDLAAPLDSTTDVGGQKLRIRVEDTQVDGTQQRMLVLEVPTILWNTVDVLLGEHFTCKAEFSRSDGPPAPYDLYLFYDVQGMYFRKWGTHQPMAVGFWSTPRDVTRQALPRSPLVGSAVYVPHVRFELPSFLPDLGFEDLRLVDVPQPILSLEYIEAKRYPSWMRRARPRGFKDWQSYGPIPPDLRLRFPDF